MKIKGLVDEDIVNYKKCSMYVIFPKCSFKCDKECGRAVCQNSSLAQTPEYEILPTEICERYVQNPLTKAIVMAGLEPFDSPFDLMVLIDTLRVEYKCLDDIIIYTGYTEKEMEKDPKLSVLFNNIKEFKNIIVKFGRFIPDDEPHFDEILGVNLASNNQYAKRIS